MIKGRDSKKIFAVLSAVFIFLLCISPLSAAASPDGSAPKELIPGGMAFGVKFFTDGAIVLGTTGVETSSGVVSPAKDAGIDCGDVIIRAGGQAFESAEELADIIAGSGGKPLVVTYLRDGNEIDTEVVPVRDAENGCYRIGVLVRDSTAGIGTVTYIDPDNLTFGGLGHGIYDSETSLLMPLGTGAVVDVDIESVVKSERSSPGELRGAFGSTAEGELWANTDEGVFGVLYKMPKNVGRAMPVGSRSELTTGRAQILTTLKGDEVCSYDVEIECIYSSSGSTKNFLIRVTDEKLIKTAGGIVQGMSGSPIIKDGKLIGAVTHVLVNDPLHGYGICIENMLNASENAADTFNSAKAA